MGNLLFSRFLLFAQNLIIWACRHFVPSGCSLLPTVGATQAARPCGSTRTRFAAATIPHALRFCDGIIYSVGSKINWYSTTNNTETTKLDAVRSKISLI